MKNLLVIFTIVLFPFVVKAQTKNFIDLPYIEVSGEADSMVTPDEIYIKIRISEKDTKDKISLEELETKMIDGLKQLGINTETDLTASDLGSNFKHYFLKKKDIIKTKSFELKTSTAAKASEVFVMLETLDISNANISRVDVSNKEYIKDILHANASKNAKQKAQLIGTSLNQKIGNAIHISDALNVADDIFHPLDMIQIRGISSYKNEDKSYIPPQIDFKKIKIQSAVNVKFVLN